jgi:hypothetical protein
MNPIVDTVEGILKPISDVIEKWQGDKHDLQMAQVQATINTAAAVQTYEQKLLDGQMDIIKAEATGASALQRNWRPITMLTFLFLVICDSFGWLHSPLAPQAWTLLQIGLGGYTVGRTVEKVALPIANAVMKK